MGKTLQARAKQGGRATKKARPARVGSKAKGAKKTTLRDANRWLSQNQEEVLQKAKENCIRLTGRETL